MIWANATIMPAGVNRDYVKATDLWIKAANKGLIEAQFQVGQCYFNGEGVQQSYVEAVKWWQLAANQEHTKSIFKLSCCYRNGTGVKKDLVKSFDLCREAAEKNDCKAQTNLGLAYYLGEGTDKDVCLAVECWKRLLRGEIPKLKIVWEIIIFKERMVLNQVRKRR